VKVVQIRTSKGIFSHNEYEWSFTPIEENSNNLSVAPFTVHGKKAPKNTNLKKEKESLYSLKSSNKLKVEFKTDLGLRPQRKKTACEKKVQKPPEFFTDHQRKCYEYLKSVEFRNTKRNELEFLNHYHLVNICSKHDIRDITEGMNQVRKYREHVNSSKAYFLKCMDSNFR